MSSPVTPAPGRSLTEPLKSVGTAHSATPALFLESTFTLHHHLFLPCLIILPQVLHQTGPTASSSLQCPTKVQARPQEVTPHKASPSISKVINKAVDTPNKDTVADTPSRVTGVLLHRAATATHRAADTTSNSRNSNTMFSRNVRVVTRTA